MILSHEFDYYYFNSVETSQVYTFVHQFCKKDVNKDKNATFTDGCIRVSEPSGRRRRWFVKESYNAAQGKTLIVANRFSHHTTSFS